MLRLFFFLSGWSKIHADKHASLLDGIAVAVLELRMLTGLLKLQITKACQDTACDTGFSCSSQHLQHAHLPFWRRSCFRGLSLSLYPLSKDVMKCLKRSSPIKPSQLQDEG